MTDGLKSIIDLVFAPFFPMVVGGGLVALINKKRWSIRQRLAFLLIVILFSINALPGIQSKRYVAILIFPSIISMVYFCRNWSRLSVCIHWRPERWQQRLGSIVVFAVIVFTCIAKDFKHISIDYVRRAVEVVQLDMKYYRFPYIINTTKDDGRILFHLASSPLPLPPLYNVDEDFAKAMLYYRLAGDVAYVFVNDQSVSENLTVPMGFQATRIFSIPRSSRNNMWFSVYRVEPPDGYPVLTRSEIERDYQMNGNYLVANGDFEQIAPESEHRDVVALLANRNIPFFQKKIMLPQKWRPNRNCGFANAAQAEVELSRAAIDGNYSLRMKATSTIAVYWCGDRRRYSAALKSTLGLIVSGEVGSRWQAQLYLYDKDGHSIGSTALPPVTVTAAGPIKYEFTVPGDDSSTHTWVPAITLYNGEVYIDDVFIRPEHGKN